MSGVIEARRALHRAILADLDNSSHAFGRYETFSHLRVLGDPQLLSRDIVRAICRDLTNRGFARYQRGLFTEDGIPAGSGYGITRRGLAYLIALEEVS
ncbi:hypothetical protein FIU89_11315 [Roseovarius sp. THAF27]|uniref:hypothetical protein n=1 Tax=Roseovarius sp. THAF27 TaxID=2587850 RepID=UPI0012679D29|nr:hypothetical protein [Roseovarius sp. THAF27]QFT81199.1 hypothetical protein FIU89_11315 [Roseovarius sp. THAF27]